MSTEPRPSTNILSDITRARQLRRPLWRHLRSASLVGLVALGGLAQAESPLPPEAESQSYDEVYEDIDGAYTGVAIERSRRVPMPTGYGHQQGTSASPAATPLEARHLGAAWLVKAQAADGGWGAGAWNTSGQAQSDVATTSIVVLALLRDDARAHQASIEKGVRFVVDAVEHAPKSSPRLRTPQGTQPQVKLGELADTHLASLMLGEVHGRVSPELNREVSIALDTVIGKVQLAQKADGSFDGNGWAPVLSNSVAAMGLMKAKELGRDVDDAALEKANAYQDTQVPGGGGGGGGGGGAALLEDGADGTLVRGGFGGAGGGGDNAGVDLYSLAGALNTAEQSMDFADEEVQGQLATRSAAVRARIAADADGVIRGFGSVGGEEMLSYMMISDALAKTGGPEWEQWDDRMGAYLQSIQNADGSWVGHHCITSPVFVTAGAVLTLGSGEAAGRSPAEETLGSNRSKSEGTGLPVGARLVE